MHKIEVWRNKLLHQLKIIKYRHREAMIEQKLEDTFGKRYIIKARRQSSEIKTSQPVTFSSEHQAYLFVRRLRAPYGYWDRTLYAVSSSIPLVNETSVTQNSAKQVSEHLYRKRMFVYELHDYSGTDTGVQKRSIEKSNGDKYTFNHPSSLLISNTLQPIKVANQAAAEALLSNIIQDKAPSPVASASSNDSKTVKSISEKKGIEKSDEKINTLAQSLNLTTPNKGAANDVAISKQLIIEALVTGAVIVTEQKRLATPPKPAELLPATAADKPPTASSSAFVASSIPEVVSKVNLKSQADTLIKAAEDAVPFCEECEKKAKAAA